VAFDHAGIAVRGFFARRAAIDERNGEAALGEVERDRGADNAGAEHDGIAARHSLFLPKHCAARAHAGGSTADEFSAGYSIWVRAGRGDKARLTPWNHGTEAVPLSARHASRTP